MLRNQQITRATKIKIYYTMIRPVVTYGSEIWSLTATEENSPRSFERKIIRRIYGTIRDHNEWTIRNREKEMSSMEARFVKSQRLRWLGHLYRMPGTRIPRRMLEGRIHHRRRIGRPKLRWLDGLENYESERMEDTNG